MGIVVANSESRLFLVKFQTPNAYGRHSVPKNSRYMGVDKARVSMCCSCEYGRLYFALVWFPRLEFTVLITDSRALDNLEPICFPSLHEMWELF